MIRSLVLIFFVSILSSCSKSSAVENSNEPAENYKHVAAQDIGMSTAIATAKKHQTIFFKPFVIQNHHFINLA
jgi:hypothetical protein